MDRGRPDRVAAAFVVVGTVARFIWVLVLHHPFDHVYSDMAGYVSRGALIATGEGLSRYDVFQPTGTQTILALPFSVFGTGRAGLWAAAVVWASLSSATVFFSWRLLRRWLSADAAALATALLALWPLHIFASGYFLADTPALAFLTGGLWLSTRGTTRSRLFGGSLLAAAVACRPELAFNAALAALFAGRFAGRRALAALACGFVLVAAPVAVWNSLTARTPTLFSQNAGFVFFTGQCKARTVTGGYPSRPFRVGSVVRLQRSTGDDFAFPGTPIYDQGFFFRRGLDCVRRDGLGHAKVVADNVLALAATSVPWPEADEAGAVRNIARVANLVYALLLPVLLVAGLVAARHGLNQLVRPLVHLATPFLAALIFMGEPRYRALYDVFGFAVLAVLISRLRPRHHVEVGPALDST